MPPRVLALSATVLQQLSAYRVLFPDDLCLSEVQLHMHVDVLKLFMVSCTSSGIPSLSSMLMSTLHGIPFL